MTLKWIALSRSLKRLLILFLVTLIVALTVPPVSAQFIFPGGGGDGNAVSRPWWDVNRAQRYGRVWASQVFLRGSPNTTLQVGYLPEPGTSSQEAAIAVEARAKDIESIFDSIYLRLTRLQARREENYSQDFLLSRITDLLEMDSEYIRQGLGGQSGPSPEENGMVPVREEVLVGQFLRSLVIATDSGAAEVEQLPPEERIHPLTPRVEVGIQNNQTVVFVPEQQELGLAQQTLVTINEADELVNGIPINTLAYLWRNRIQESFDNALWGNELDRNYPVYRYWVVFKVLLGALVAIALVGLIRAYAGRHQRKLEHQLKRLTQSLTQETAAGMIEQSPSLVEEEEEQLAEAQESLAKNPNHGPADNPASDKPNPPVRLQDRVSDAWQNIGDLANMAHSTLKRQSIIRQRINFLILVRWVLFWIQVSIIFVAAGMITFVFPVTRPYTMMFVGQATYFPLLWIGVTLLDKIAGIIADNSLSRWAREQQKFNNGSGRYALRASTYSPAIKGGISIIATICGILGTIWLFGVNPLVLASFGGVAFVVAFLARNVVEDMLNGTLILWTDRYAIGDVIQIGDIAGLVENMNIYVTQLRGAEGRLSTIPNGQISVVQNLTKDWSRAEFVVEVDQAADVEKALHVVKDVSDQMQNDPDWGEKIIEPAAILGVDNIASHGIRLQVWIKTQPGQHWGVGREFRLRVKKAFEQTGINLGAPHQRIIYYNDRPNGNGPLAGQLPEPEQN